MNPDRNAGFSSANPQKLYLPVNIDPAYHYEAINVESQLENSTSLLNWTKRLIALRKQYKAFGRGTLEFLQPSNQRVLAYLRRYQEEIILVVANLSRFSQAVQLDLQKFANHTPVEMFGKTDFPPIGETPYYTLTLGPNSFFWFSLEPREVPVAVTASTPAASTPEVKLPTIFVHSLANIWEDSIRASITSVLPKFLQTRRWFRSRERRFRSLEIKEIVPIREQEFQFIFVRAEFTTGDAESYLLPIGFGSEEQVSAIREKHPEAFIAEVRASDSQPAFLYNATCNPEFATILLDSFARRKRYAGRHGSVTSLRNREFRRLWGSTHPDFTPEMLPSSEVASSVRFGDRFVMKLFANIEPGIHPGVEIGEALNLPPSNFSHAAPLAGHMVYESSTGEVTTLAVLHGFVPNSGDAWQRSRQEVDSFLLRMQAADAPGMEGLQSSASRFCDLKLAAEPPAAIATGLIGRYLAFATTLGQRTAELHQQMAKVKDDPAFTPEAFNDFYRQGLYHGYVGLTGRRLEFLRQHYAEMRPDARALAEKVLEQEAAILLKFNAIYEQRVTSVRSRFHGRLHLGHMLVTGEDDAVIFDFEGDPALHLSERRIKRCPLRDVASMLISFGYSAQASIRSSMGANGVDKVTEDRLRVAARFWYSHVSAAFLRGYLTAAEGAAYLPKTREHQQILIDAYLLERSLLDIRADIQSRPELAGMQFRMILHLLDKEDEFQPGKLA